MRYTNYVFCLFLITHIEAYGTRPLKSCADCIHLDRCGSVEYSKQHDSSNEHVKKIYAEYCGFDIGIKVCCSALEGAVHGGTLEKHKNIGLLPNKCGSIHGNRIYGGTIPQLHELPWMALISYQTDDGNAFQCAGSIINSRYILTAAHCLVHRNILGVRIGEFDIRSEYDCQTGTDGRTTCADKVQDIKVEERIFHEEYKGFPKYAFDIGLLRLARPIDFTHRNAAPICLPATDKLRSTSIENRMATVAGWGLTENKTESSVLLKVDVPIHPDDECFSFYSRILETSSSGKASSQFCAGSYQKDSCKGDSGAPLFIEDKYNGVDRAIQFGIVSQGPVICGSGSPAVYTAVSSHILWILDKLRP